MSTGALPVASPPSAPEPCSGRSRRCSCRPISRSAATGRTMSDAAFFAVGCPCGHRVLTLLGHQGPVGPDGQDEGLTGPLAVKCPACARNRVVRHTRTRLRRRARVQHVCRGGWRAFSIRVPVLRGNRVFPVRRPLLLVAWRIGLTVAGRAQDFFGGFHLLGQCRALHGPGRDRVVRLRLGRALGTNVGRRREDGRRS